jgi:hypothetical protein
VESSYEEEESSTGVQMATPTRSIANSSISHTTRNSHKQSYAEQVQEAVDRQVHQWMTSSSAAADASDSVSETSSATTPSKSGIKQDPTGHYYSYHPQTSNNNTNKTSPSKTQPRPVVHARAEQTNKVHRMMKMMSHDNHATPSTTTSTSSSAVLQLPSSTMRGLGNKSKVSPLLLDCRIQSIQDVYGKDQEEVVVEEIATPNTTTIMIGNTLNNTTTDPCWEETMSDLSTSYSKTSSAYFNTRQVQAIRTGQPIPDIVRHDDHRPKVAAAATAATLMRRYICRVLQRESLTVKVAIRIVDPS